MIHTMQLTFKATGDLYQSFVDNCVPRQKDNPEKPVVHRYINPRTKKFLGYFVQTDIWKDCGVAGITDNKAYRFTAENPDTGEFVPMGFFFELRINLAKFVNPSEHIQVYQSQDREKMIEAFNAAMDLLEIGMPHWEYWNAKRVDYCYNIHTPYVKYYVGDNMSEETFTPLLHKGKHPYHTEPKNWIWDENRNKKFSEDYVTQDGEIIKIYTDERAKNRDKMPGSLYMRWKGFTANFYNKADEVRKSIAFAIDQKNINRIESLWNAYPQSREILRLEVQCSDTKLNTLKQGRSKSRAASLFLDPAIGRTVLENAIKELTEAGDYYRTKTAERLINHSSYHNTTKTEMILLQKLIRGSKRNIKNVEKSVVKKGIMSRGKFKSRLKGMSKIGVNPVTIPQTAKKIEGLTVNDGLPCIMDLFTAAVSQERNEDLEVFAEWLSHVLEIKDAHDEEMKWHGKSLVGSDEWEQEIDSDYGTEAD